MPRQEADQWDVFVPISFEEPQRCVRVARAADRDPWQNHSHLTHRTQYPCDAGGRTMRGKAPCMIALWFGLMVLLSWIAIEESRGQRPLQLRETITSSKDGAPMVLIAKGAFTYGMNRSE